MPTTQPIENNITQTLNVIDGLDMDIASNVQYLLIPVYQKFPFLIKTLWGVPLGNILAAFVVLCFFLFLRKFFTNIFTAWLQTLAKKTPTHYDERIISALKKPLGFAFPLLGIHLFFLITFQETGFIKNMLNMLVVFVIFWAIISMAEALKGLLYKTTEKLNPDLSREMANFILKIIKILIGGVGLAAMLQVWGINVTALLASLGLGGLAFALAAKDTASNLFGSFAILADKSIRIGEWIKVGDVEGVVEDVGMRTTKIRTFEKSLVTVPNQIVANHPIENFSRRGVRRFKMNIGLTYSTSGEQVKHIVHEIRYLLHNHENISQDETILVNFKEFGDSALNIFVYAFTHTSNWKTYMDIRQEIQLRIMQIVETNGSSFAFPSQSVYVESMPQRDQ
jgi:MscS family membrane protein